MVDYAALVLDIDSGPARTAATDLAKFNQAAVKASAGADKISKATRDARGRFISVSASVEKYGGEVERLAQKYNPALAAVYKFQQEQVSLNRAVALGVITQQQADAALERYTASVGAAAAASTRLGAAQKNTGAYTANVFAQLNDIGVMLAAGQSPIQLALQQGTQLNQVWAQMGEQGKTLRGVAGMLGSAFMQMINPMSLLTIGVIAGTAALVQWAFSADDAEDSGNKLEDITGDLSAAFKKYDDAIKAANASLSDITDEYGANFQQAKLILEQAKLISKASVEFNISETAKKAKVEFQEVFTILEKIDSLMRHPGSAYANSLETRAIQRQVSQLNEQFGITEQQARAVASAIEQMSIAATQTDMVAAMIAFADAVTAAHAQGAKLNGDLISAAQAANEAAQSGAKLTATIVDATSATNNWANAMWGVRSAVAGILSALNSISGQAIGIAAAKAEIDALKAGKKAAEARHIGEIKRIQLEGAERTKQLEREMGVRGKIQGIIIQTAEIAEANIQRQVAIEREAAQKRERAGGGGGLKQAQNQFQSLRELLEQETIFQYAEWEKRQAQLDNALKRQLLSIEQYELMKSQLQTFYFGTEMQKAQLNYQMSLEQLEMFHQQGLIKEEAYQIQLAQLRGQYLGQLQAQDNNSWSVQLGQMADAFGQMNQLAGGGYDGLLKAQRIFGAASALISTYTGAAEALKLPFPYNMAAMAKVLAAGMGLVNAIKSGSSNPKSRGGGGSASTAQSAVKEQPTQYMYIRLQGDEWAVSMAENILEQIYDQSKDGRRIIFERYK